MASQQPARKDDIVYATIAELGEMLRGRRITSKDLTLSYIERIKQVDPKLNAFITVTEEMAIEQAERADKEIQRGSYLGPLHGIPYGAKDLLATKGIPTTWGSKIFAKQVFDFDATVISRLRDAGAVLLGKLNMIELAGGTGYKFGSASANGATHNPWDLSRWAGGSSSGAGAAVAAGLVGFAIGSETWGSIVVPSAFCGITGLRPSYGRVSRYGAMANSWTMDKIGPMARSVEDCRFILEAINGTDPQDPTVKSSWRFTPRQKPARIGVLNEAASDISKPVADAIDVLRKNGHDIQPCKLPDLPYESVAATIQRAEACSAFWPLIRDGRLQELSDEGLKTSFVAGLNIRAIDYIQANRMRAQIESAVKELHSLFDVIVAPTLPVIANKLEDDIDKVFGTIKDPLGALGNVAGLPCLSVPCGFSNRMPVGMQILGAYGKEDDVLSVGMDYQKSTDSHKQRPPL
jgi:aspartyl-tRNA(Asn)/glutamyl-tRNA(Gln) amidotransferase subunit A